MAELGDTSPDAPKDDIPAFKFSPKKVDDSWKEEARKEREAAIAARTAAAAKAAAAQAAAVNEAVAATAPAGSAETAGAAAPSTGDAPLSHAGASGASAPAASADAATAPPVKQPSPIELQQTKIFLNFVDGLAQQALMQLGELENPYTGQAEMDIQGARYTIELLAVILAKTHGNLTDGEHKALTGVLSDLKTHFAAIAQELQRQMAAQAAQKGPMRPGPGGTLC